MKGNQHVKKYLIGLLTASLLGACSWMPSPTQQGPQSQIQADVLTTASTASNSQSQPRPPEKITFPSMVKTTEAQDVPDDEISQLKALLESEWGFSILGDDDKGFGKKGSGKDDDDDHDDHDSENHRSYVLDFKSKKAEGKYQVQMPATGSFKLVMEAGSKFEVPDNNATDGEAKVRIPAGQLDTLIRLAGESK